MTQNNPTNPFGDKRTALAFFLSLIIIIAYTELFTKPQTQQRLRTQNEQLANAPQQLPGSAQTPQPSATGPVAATGPQVTTPQQSSKESQNAPAATASALQQDSTPTLPGDLPTPEAIADSPTLTVRSSLFEAEILHLGAQLKHFPPSTTYGNTWGRRALRPRSPGREHSPSFWCQPPGRKRSKPLISESDHYDRGQGERRNDLP
jgi:hypothetical protein